MQKFSPAYSVCVGCANGKHLSEWKMELASLVEIPREAIAFT